MCISVQFSHSIVSDSLQPIDCSTPGFPVHHQLPELVQTHVHQASDAIQPSHSLSSPSPTANEYSGLISFRIDWLDLLEVQGTLKSLLQHHSSQVDKKSPANTGGMRCRFDLWVGKIPWSRAWQLTPIFCLENSMDRGAWWSTVHGVTKSWTQPK